MFIGKTITSVSIALDAVAKGRRVMFVCDRVKTYQAINRRRLTKAGIEIGVIQSHNDRYNPRAMVQIASIQTLARRMKIRMPEFEFCIIDECHTHYKAIQYMMDRYSNVAFYRVYLVRHLVKG